MGCSPRVYYNAAKLEIKDFGRTDLIGWFADEVDAVAAAYEHVLKSFCTFHLPRV
jgi:hypothetical protein